MTHETFLSLLPRYPDDLTEAERAALFAHADECEACAEALAEHEAMLRLLGTMDDALEVPRQTAAAWRSAIHNEDTKPAKRGWLSRAQGWAVAAAAVLVLIGGTALMREGVLFPAQTAETPPITYSLSLPDTAAAPALPESAPAMMRGTPEAEEEAEADVSPAAEHSSAVPMLRTAALSLQTANFDADLPRVLSLLEAYGGTMSLQTIGNESDSDGLTHRIASLTFRLPVDGLDDFIAAAQDLAPVTSFIATQEDISGAYTKASEDLAQATRRLEEANGRLQAALPEDAGLGLLQAEHRQAEQAVQACQQAIDALEDEARHATATVTLTENAQQAQARTPLRQRLWEAMQETWRFLRAFGADMLVFLARALPYLLCLLLAGGVVCGVLHTLRKKRKKEL